MHIALKVVLSLLGALLLFQGATWIFAPAMAAEGLGMTLLEGRALSTQIGDLGSFFLSVGTMIILGIVTLRPTWFQAAAMLLLLTAIMRTVAWGMYGAVFETGAIVIEIVGGILCLLAASKAQA